MALAALEGVVSKLEEEYLALLPEAIPFLSELFEDPDEAVEGAARTLTARLTELSGEDLKSLMRDGGSGEEKWSVDNVVERRGRGECERGAIDCDDTSERYHLASSSRVMRDDVEVVVRARR